MENDLIIYQKVNEYIEEGLVTPFDNDLLLFLANHTDSSNKKITNYLSALNSTYSISKCYRFSRYLCLGINSPFHLYEGKLKNLDNGDFTHAWIETDNFVYDVSFIGKWPKDLYYQLFNPQIDKIIDLNNDEKYQNYKKDTIKVENNINNPFLKYIDWYNYKSFALSPNPYMSPTINWLYFPQNRKQVDENFLISFIEDEWNKQNIEYPIPPELFSKNLQDYIEHEDFIKGKYFLYSELIKFITHNYELYEDKKALPSDLSLWKKAIEGKYSGSFCILISNIPDIVKQINSKEDTLSSKKL